MAARTADHRDGGPRRLTFAQVRVVRATIARGLTHTVKYVFEQTYGVQPKLGNGGAVISASDLGRLIGASRQTVERARADLLRFGMLKKRDHNGAECEWWAVLPIRCPQVRQFSKDERERYAEDLARHIASLSGDGDEGGTEPEEETSSPP
jgi:hypothetical protein